MNKRGLVIEPFLILAFLTLIFFNCEKEHLHKDNLSIYGTWIIRTISGGFSGGGYPLDFDYLEINQNNTFSIFRKDTIAYYGNIEIEGQLPDDMTIRFISESDNNRFFLDIKHVKLRPDSLVLTEDCCDSYNYHFVSCKLYNDANYIQSNKTLDYLNITKYSIGINRFFTSLFFVNENIGFITCTDGSILKTINGGKNWSLKLTTNELPLYDIYFINESLGFAVGGKSGCGGTGCVVPGNVLLKTTDGGENWIKQNIQYDWSEFNKVTFINSSQGFAMGIGIKIKTIDSGKSWENFTTTYMGYIYDLNYLNESTVYFSGLSGKLFRTTNGGVTWDDLSINADYHLYSVRFVNQNVGYLGSYKNLMKTIDGGKTWTALAYAPKDVTKMYFTSENNGVVFGSRDYSSGSCNAWNSKIHILVNGKWFGDERVSSYSSVFSLNPKQYFLITNNSELTIITVNN